MKRILAAAFAFSALAGVATAQETTSPADPTPPAPPAFASTCPALPAAPAIPDGATARERDMAAAEASVQAWNSAYVGIINNCRQEEVRRIQAEMEASVAAARAAQAHYQAAVAAYNADSENSARVGAAWMAQVEAYTNRTRRR